jgi:hypothetical protein
VKTPYSSRQHSARKGQDTCITKLFCFVVLDECTPFNVDKNYTGNRFTRFFSLLLQYSLFEYLFPYHLLIADILCALTHDELCSGVYEEESPMGHTQLEGVRAHHGRVCGCMCMSVTLFVCVCAVRAGYIIVKYCSIRLLKSGVLLSS